MRTLLIVFAIFCVAAPAQQVTERGKAKPTEEKPIALSEASQQLADAVLALVGNEIAGEPNPFTSSFAEGTVRLIGFAFCSPSDPAAPPNPNPSDTSPMYGCRSTMTASLTPNADATKISMVFETSTLFVDGDGRYRLKLVPNSGPFEAYVLAHQVRIEASAPLVDVGKNTRKIGAVETARLSFESHEVEVNLNDPLLDPLLDQLQGMLISSLRLDMNSLAKQVLDAAIPGLPAIRIR